MHLPNPFGGYPLVLRSSDVENPRNGELLFNYNTDDLMYVDKKSGEINKVSDSIYHKLIEIRIENSDIDIVKANDDVFGYEPVIPDVELRRPNSWYMNIYKRR